MTSKYDSRGGGSASVFVVEQGHPQGYGQGHPQGHGQSPPAQRQYDHGSPPPPPPGLDFVSARNNARNAIREEQQSGRKAWLICLGVFLIIASIATGVTRVLKYWG